MIKSTELMIGDLVLVSGTPRRVESITKKKIGYHINPQTDNRLYYARLHDVEPIVIYSVVDWSWGMVCLRSSDCEFLLSGSMTFLSSPSDNDALYIDFPTGNTKMETPFYLHHAIHMAKAFDSTPIRLEKR